MMSAGTVTSLSFSRTELIGLIRSRAEFRPGKEYTGLLLIGGEFFKILLLRIYWWSERTIAAIGVLEPSQGMEFAEYVRLLATLNGEFIHV